MRASRLLSILIALQLNRRVTAAALAARFEVSMRTVYRDIDALSAAGVPVYADRGPGGGFALLDGWRMQPAGLFDAEAEAMFVAGLPGPARALGIGAASAAAQDKLRAALSPAAGARAAQIAARFHFDFVDWYRATEDLPHLPAVARAVLDSRMVTLRYESWRQARDWRAAPLGLVMKGGHWYLVARDDDERIVRFRVSNMSDVTVTGTTFEPPAGFDLAMWWGDANAAFEARLRPCTVTVRVEGPAQRRLRDLGSYAARALRDGRAIGDSVEVDLPVEDLDQAARLVLGLGTGATAQSPDLRARIVALADAMSVAHGAMPVDQDPL